MKYLVKSKPSEVYEGCVNIKDAIAASEDGLWADKLNFSDASHIYKFIILGYSSPKKEWSLFVASVSTKGSASYALKLLADGLGDAYKYAFDPALNENDVIATAHEIAAAHNGVLKTDGYLQKRRKSS